MFAGLSRRNVVKALFLGGAMVILSLRGAVLTLAEDYPVRPITIHVGFAPGAASGNSAQVFAEGVKKYLPTPQPVLVNFKPGASSAIAADFVLKQPADGYNLFWFPVDLVGKLAKDGNQLSFKMEDFIPIGCMGESPGMLTVNSEKSPFLKFEDFLEYAKKNPGKLSYGTPGIGSVIHLSGEIFQMRCGIKLNHIPFSGGAPAMTALLGGHTDCYLGSPGTYGAQIKPGGGLRVLTVFAKERWPELVDVPTCLEKGYDVDRVSWYYLAAPKGTSQNALDFLLTAFKKTANDPQVKTSLFKLGFTPVYIGPEETKKKARAEFEVAKEIYKKVGLL